MARVRLHERHQLTLKRKLKKMKEDLGIFHAPVTKKSSSASQSSQNKTDASETRSSTENKRPDDEPDEDLEERCLRDYESGRYSPVLLMINELDLEIQKRCINENDDFEKLRQQRESVLKSGSVKVRTLLQHHQTKMLCRFLTYFSLMLRTLSKITSVIPVALLRMMPWSILKFLWIFNTSGQINIDRENLVSSTKSTRFVDNYATIKHDRIQTEWWFSLQRVTIGINTIKSTTTPIIHHQKQFKVTNSM